jgi:hypothetical protein
MFDYKMAARSTQLLSTVSPKYIYSIQRSLLQRVDLLTGEFSWHSFPPDYEFKIGSVWSELPGEILLITGGVPYEDNPDVEATIAREVAKIDTLKEFAVWSVPPMHSGRSDHAAVYHSQYLYVLGGYLQDNFMSECERYVLAESRWEVLPALPVGGCSMSAVELDNCLYALGGEIARLRLDTVQKLSLNSLTWELMQLKLPERACHFPFFKIDTDAYLIIGKTMYSFTASKSSHSSYPVLFQT